MEPFTFSAIAAAPRDLVPVTAGAWARKHGLPPVWQLGIAVADMRGAMQALEELGCPAFLDLAGKPRAWVERGAARKIRGNLALSYQHGMEIELLARSRARISTPSTSIRADARCCTISGI